MTILVTGGAGFIGSHLCEYLLNNNQKVIVIDDLSTGSMTNISHLTDHSAFRFYEGSISDESLLACTIEESDMVYHLAASVGVKLVVEKPGFSQIISSLAHFKHTCKKRVILVIYHRKFFWIFRKILG